MQLLDQLHTAELKRDQLYEETRNVLTPAEEREKLLNQIKDNNQEITAIEKKLIFFSSKFFLFIHKIYKILE